MLFADGYSISFLVNTAKEQAAGVVIGAGLVVILWLVVQALRLLYWMVTAPNIPKPLSSVAREVIKSVEAADPPAWKVGCTGQERSWSWSPYGWYFLDCAGDGKTVVKGPSFAYDRSLFIVTRNGFNLHPFLEDHERRAIDEAAKRRCRLLDMKAMGILEAAEAKA